MEYNDIKSRLSRTLSSLNDRFDDDIEKHTRIEQKKDGRGLSIIFGKDDDEESLNKIMIILYNLSSLKDHIKNQLSKKGLDPQIVEDEINNSLHLQVMVDIINQEKHGAPLTRPRSNKNPVIRYPSIGYFPFIESKTNGSDFGSMQIHALIKDDKEKLLFRLDELVETCYSKWESIIKEYRLAD